MGTKRRKFEPVADEGEAEIQRQIAADPDDWEATDSQLRGALPFAEVFPALAESISRARGRPVLDNPKRQVTLRLDADIVEKFRAGGPGWQTRVNNALRKAAAKI